jgi:hypothetical protein
MTIGGAVAAINVAELIPSELIASAEAVCEFLGVGIVCGIPTALCGPLVENGLYGEAGKPEDQDREQCAQDEHAAIRAKERERTAHYCRNRHLGSAANRKEIETNGWDNGAHLNAKCKENPKVDRVDAERD